MKRPLDIAFLGTGFIASKHARILKNRTDVRIIAGVDMVPGRATAFLSELELPDARAYQSFEALLAAETPDLVYVCLPPFAHGGEVEQLAARGIHLFLEKPIALDSDRATSMVKSIEKAGIKSQVGFFMRFLKSVTRLKAEMAAGRVGRPLLMTGRYWANFNGPTWWRDPKKSGGQVFEQVCHVYDLVRYLMGEPVRVHGAMNNLAHGADPDYGIEDTSGSLTVFAGGGMACITGSNAALPNRFINDFRIVCEGGMLDLRSTGDWREKDVSTLTLHENGTEKEIIEIVEDGDPFGDESDNLIRAIRDDGTTTSPVREGLSTIEFIERVYRSAGSEPT